jgi:hypothetical protein
MKTTVTFSLDTEQDGDILTYLGGLPKRQKSKTFRDAMRAHIGNAGLTLGDVYQELAEIRRMLRHSAVVAHSADDPGNLKTDDPEIAEVKAILAGLGL